MDRLIEEVCSHMDRAVLYGTEEAKRETARDVLGALEAAGYEVRRRRPAQDAPRDVADCS